MFPDRPFQSLEVFHSFFHFSLVKEDYKHNKIKNVKNAKAEYKGPNDVNFSSLIRGVHHPAGR